MLFRFALAGVASAALPSFEEWASQFGFNDADDTMKAKYQGNLEEIARLRAKHPEADFGVNQFSGMTYDEFAQQMLTLKEDPLANSDIPLLEGPSDLSALATDVDWDVTPVKDQGACGSCWAFSAIGSIEHGHKLESGETVDLAEQQLVDCDKTSSGCDGGMTYTAMTFLSGKPIYTTASYPYTARDGSCKTGTDSGVRITGYNGLAKTEEALLQGLNVQAVSIIVYADSSFQAYQSGVINAPTTCSLNHGVLATGYTSEYIKIKNSWGTSWGEAGYIRVKRSTEGCGPYGMFYSTNSYPKGFNPSPSPPAPTPRPTPSPAPTPAPTPSGCTDNESEYYCNYVKEQDYCDLIGYDCLKTCKCCNNPSKCGDPLLNKELRAKTLEALSVAV